MKSEETLTPVVDNLTAEEFLEIVNDPLFVGGVSKAIEMTQKRNCETKFDVFRSPSENQTYFDERIEIGDKTSIGNGIRHIPLREEFEKLYGPAPTCDIKNFTINEIMKWHDDYSSYKERLEQFLREKQEDFHVTFPNLPTERTRIYSNHFLDRYQLMQVHTHPTEIISFKNLRGLELSTSYVNPSRADLRNLLHTRKEVRKDESLPEIGFYKPIIIANPLSMIIGTSEMKYTYELGLIVCHNDKINSNDIEDSVKNFRSGQLNFSTDGNFSYTVGSFDSSKKRISFSPHTLDVMLEREK